MVPGSSYNCLVMLFEILEGLGSVILLGRCGLVEESVSLWVWDLRFQKLKPGPVALLLSANPDVELSGSLSSTVSAWMLPCFLPW